MDVKLFGMTCLKHVKQHAHEFAYTGIYIQTSIEGCYKNEQNNIHFFSIKT